MKDAPPGLKVGEGYNAGREVSICNGLGSIRGSARYALGRGEVGRILLTNLGAGAWVRCCGSSVRAVKLACDGSSELKTAVSEGRAWRGLVNWGPGMVGTCGDSAHVMAADERVGVEMLISSVSSCNRPAMFPICLGGLLVSLSTSVCFRSRGRLAGGGSILPLGSSRMGESAGRWVIIVALIELNVMRI